jgi:hypothetical protein
VETVLSLNPSVSSDLSLSSQLRKVGRALTAPSRFFRFDYPRSTTAGMLTFGIANAWAAAVFAFFLTTVNSLLVSSLLDNWAQRLVSSEDSFVVWDISAHAFLWQAGLLLLTPFFLLAQVVFCAVWTYLFARLLIDDHPGAPEPVTYAAALRIQAAALVGDWYSFVPLFGGFLAFIVGLSLTVTGVRERFGVSTRRAVAVVVLPYFVMAALLVVVLMLGILMIAQLPFQDLIGELNLSQYGF